jgi:hypothetical protein
VIYLASPYSDPDPAVMEQRFDAVCRKAGELTASSVCSVGKRIEPSPLGFSVARFAKAETRATTAGFSRVAP